MAYDVARGRTVLFGGSKDIATPLRDTWEWDGTSWTQLQPATRPSERDGHAMAYLAPGRIVLFGGNDLRNLRLLDDTWEWNGAAWTQTRSSLSPGGRSAHALVNDEARNQLLLLGGSGNGWAIDEGWRFGAFAPAAAETFGIACGGARGVPVLSGSEPYIGNAGFVLDLASAHPTAACLFALSRGQQSLQVGGGCTLYLRDPLLLLPATTNVFGFASSNHGVPLDASLRGTTLYGQAFVADPQGPVLGLSFTSGRKLVLGD
jgi:hypothetical protein